MRVYLDESGQEWANLMAPSSGPVATYGSTSLPDDDAAELLDEFRPTGLSKKHKSKAWLRPNTVEATIAVLHRAPPEALVVGVAYRPWFAVAKLVSLAVDEGHYEAKGFSLETLRAPDGRPLGAVLAERFWDQLRIPGTVDLTPEGSAGLVDFQQFVLRGDPAAGDRLLRWTDDCRAAAADDLARGAWELARAWFTSELERVSEGEGRTWSAPHLAPTLPLLVEVLREWGRRLGTRAFEVVHDRSTEVEHHLLEFLGMGQLADETWASAPGHVALPAFIPGRETEFGSKGPALALADLTAGAVRVWMAGRLVPASLGPADLEVANALQGVEWLPMIGANSYLGP